MEVKAGFGPDDIIGLGNFLLDGPLGAIALLDLFGGPTAGQQALALSGGGTGDANCGIQFVLSVGFEKERDDDNGERAAFGMPSLDLSAPESADARRKDVLKPLAGSGIRENAAGKFVTAEPAIGTNDLLAEGLLNFGQSGLAGFDNLAGEEVSVRDRHTALAEQLVGGGLAHANAAGQANQFHEIRNPESEI